MGQPESPVHPQPAPSPTPIPQDQPPFRSPTTPQSRNSLCAFAPAVSPTGDTPHPTSTPASPVFGFRWKLSWNSECLTESPDYRT